MYYLYLNWKKSSDAKERSKADTGQVMKTEWRTVYIPLMVWFKRHMIKVDNEVGKGL